MIERVRVIVSGDRRWNCRSLAIRIVYGLMVKHGTALLIVHGAAPGVDSAFAEACNDLGVDFEPHPADWQAHGRAAGPIRNGEMIAAGAAMVIACHRNLAGSRGTRDCVKRALAAGIPVWLVEDDKSDRIEAKRVEKLP